MSDIAHLDVARARKLAEEAAALKDAGDIDGAIAKYREAIRFNPTDAWLYNLALIHKYRGEWREAFDLNRRAYELDPEEEATRWNLGIAATALRDWTTAREMWTRCGMKLAAGDGPVDDDFGSTPVRLNPDGDAEVVWARRLGPVRARITSVPLPESGFRYHDIVLHDGAAVGYRMSGEVEKPVFNVLELFEASTFGTWRLDVVAQSEQALDAMAELCSGHGIELDDWTGMRYLCRQCSEGHPHDEHDHDGDEVWEEERSIGAAATSQAAIDALAGLTLPPGVALLSSECMIRPCDS
ncbi:MAG TPA: tetratricopeptide repeat protein [Telluria sp.]|nr:tetratricopeptide repeat protein [Telluria sp.]